LLRSEADVLGDLSEECRRDITAGVKRDCRPSTVGVPELLVGATLPDLAKAEPVEKRHHFAWLERGQMAH